MSDELDARIALALKSAGIDTSTLNEEQIKKIGESLLQSRPATKRVTRIQQVCYISEATVKSKCLGPLEEYDEGKYEINHEMDCVFLSREVNGFVCRKKTMMPDKLKKLKFRVAKDLQVAKRFGECDVNSMNTVDERVTEEE